MALKWNLRKVMAGKNIWSGAELGRLLLDLAGYKLSAPSIRGLASKTRISYAKGILKRKKPIMRTLRLRKSYINAFCMISRHL